ncbi:unnamed protein product [Effrenium voratum]|nr:unnamed protein product [Effrenium voratum]
MGRATSVAIPLGLDCFMHLCGNTKRWSSFVLASRPKGGGAWQVTQLTEIHRADRQDESERITKAGGKVVHFEGEPPRLVADEWCLAVSRSWGDFHAAKLGNHV